MDLGLIPPQILVPGFGSPVENPFNNEDGEEAHRDEAGEALTEEG